MFLEQITNVNVGEGLKFSSERVEVVVVLLDIARVLPVVHGFAVDLLVRRSPQTANENVYHDLLLGVSLVQAVAHC